MTPRDVVHFAEEQGVEFVDLRCVDLTGALQHVTVPVGALTEEVFRDGLVVAAAERLLLPVPETAYLDPLYQYPTLGLICDILDPRSAQASGQDARVVARRAVSHLRASAIADAAGFAPGLEFFIFDQAHFEQGAHFARYGVDSAEGAWRRGRDEPDNLGLQLARGGGAFANPPGDSLANLRSEMVLALQQARIGVARHYHGAAGGGQARIDLQPDALVAMADKVMLGKYIIKNVAARHGKVVTFMPQPIFGEPGNGMPTGFALWKGEQACFAGESDGSLSAVARYAIGGILKHAASLLAFTNPTTNSYKRLASWAAATLHRGYAADGEGGLIGVAPAGSDSAGRPIEIRIADGSANPYLAFSAIVLAALDGVAGEVDPGPALDARGGSVGEPGAGERLPVTLDGALAALEHDHAYLLKGDVFTADLLEHWIALKRGQEVAALAARPHPWEFCQYFDV